ncbi:FecR family protein [Gaoshiqia sediminis]|uniref:FecR domain-containing protein n=1 Tax=Gaoshiqia sediminis TaxID=2986998 RepID=A0AA41Y8G5_9BACT|nr:FecR domain-containing protein [Gaoshiqia sediminis]MCW0483112.1 FecR domain-containing protein [Gaoshiqia sediminis]
MEKEKQLIELISGNLDAAQREQVLKEIGQDPALRKQYEDLKNAWALSASQTKMGKQQIEASYHKFRQKQPAAKGRMLKISTVMRYAAILLVIFALGIYLGQLITSGPGSISGIETTTAEIRVPNGEKAELTLPDGSRVWLNSGTTFRFPQQFAGNSREVSLTGEAFFEVVKGKAPFIVSSDYGDIRVLGTSFNVRAYDNLDFQATLVEGKIQFNTEDKEQLLAPGQQLSLTARRELIVEAVDTEKAISWKNGFISFENEPLSEVTKRLERHFGIQISLDEQLAPIRFTGTIYNETVTEVMAYIQMTKPITYAYDQKQGILKISTN